MSMVTLTIDGREVEVDPGSTVIEAVRKLGADVPHYCWHPGLSVAGNCRICLVEVEGMPTVQISCNLGVRDGMVVHTQSEKAKAARQDVMELLLINHPLDCPICDQAGECKLQEYSFEFGTDGSRFAFPKVHKPKHVRFSEKVVFDAERCILCTRCVRFLDEVAGQDELDIVHRGDRNEIAVARGKELESPYQMNIIDICPVGALTSTDFRFKSRVWFLKQTRSICPGCSRGCNVTVGARWNRVLRLVPAENHDVNKWWMCDEGRFTYKDVEADDRLGAPMVRRSGTLEEVSWDEALEAAVEGLRACGGDLVAAVSARLTNEELHLAAKILDEVGAKARGFAPRDFAQDDMLRTGDGNPNSAGAGLMGIPSGVPSLDGAKGAVLLGEDLDEAALATLDGMEFVLWSGTHESEAMQRATVVLPGLTPFEKDGSFTNVDGRIQRVQRVVAGPGSAQPEWKWLGRLLALLTGGDAPRSADAVLKSMGTDRPAFEGLTLGRLGPLGKPAAEPALAGEDS
jgi:NADH-quinone oxidoreductase subunit G